MRCMMFSCLKGLIIVHVRQLIMLGHRKAYVEYFILFLSASASTPCCCAHSLKVCCSGLCDVFRVEQRKEGTNFLVLLLILAHSKRLSPVMSSKSLHKTIFNLRRRNKNLD